MVEMMSKYILMNSYQALSRSIHKVFKELPVLRYEEEEVIEKPIRLTSSTIDVASRLKRCSAVVTAHDLSQYVNRFYTMDLSESDVCWLDYLLEPEDEFVYDYGGLV